MTKESELRLPSPGFSNLQLRYEQLRQQRLDGVFTLAINVFVEKGMCGWIHAWTDPALASDCETKFQTPLKKDPGHKDRPADGGNAGSELVALIASMALTKIRGGMNCERKSV